MEEEEEEEEEEEKEDEDQLIGYGENSEMLLHSGLSKERLISLKYKGKIGKRERKPKASNIKNVSKDEKSVKNDGHNTTSSSTTTTTITQPFLGNATAIPLPIGKKALLNLTENLPLSFETPVEQQQQQGFEFVDEKVENMVIPIEENENEELENILIDDYHDIDIDQNEKDDEEEQHQPQQQQQQQQRILNKNERIKKSHSGSSKEHYGSKDNKGGIKKRNKNTKSLKVLKSVVQKNKYFVNEGDK